MLEVNVQYRAGAFTMDAEFTAETGTVTSLFGRSGAGKTTLVNMIAGLMRPETGFIRLENDVLFDSEQRINVAPEARHIGYVFQDGRLFPHMTVRSNLMYGVRGDGGLDLDQVTRLLDLKPLLGRKPATLSGGERQRVAIGRALLSSPRMLLMDEPLANIDIQRRTEILPFIERLREETGLTIIYVSHEIEEVIRLADTLVLLSDGRVAATGGVEELMSRIDLKPLTGRYESGAVLSTVFGYFDDQFGLGHLSFPGGTLRVPGVNVPPGTQLRAHIRARDVSLALTQPAEVSILNVFEGTVAEIGDENGPQLDVRLDIGAPLIARVTRKSVHDLKLSPGKKVYALVKAVAIDRRSLGGQGREKGREQAGTAQ